MNDDDLNELIDAFTAETQEFLQSMETHLLAMEAADLKGRQASVKEMFRAAHSIKGAGSMLGFQNVSAAAHTLEDCFVILRDRTDLSALEPVTVSVLLQGVDILKKIATEAIQHSDVITPDQTENLQAIVQIHAQFEHQYGKPEPPPVPTGLLPTLRFGWNAAIARFWESRRTPQRFDRLKGLDSTTVAI